MYIPAAVALSGWVALLLGGERAGLSFIVVDEVGEITASLVAFGIVGFEAEVVGSENFETADGLYCLVGTK